MDKLQLIEKAKNLVLGSRTGEALDLVEKYLRPDPKYRALHNEAVRLSAFFKQTKREADGELVSFENAKVSYNQINDQLLRLIGFIETNNLDPEALRTPANPWQLFYKTHRWQVLTAVPTLVLAVAVLFFVLKNGGKTNEPAETDDPTVTAADCPFPTDDRFNILLLHFYLPAGDNLNPEGLIAEKLETFCAENSINASVEILKKSKNPDRLLDYQPAKELGQLCRAKMVVWGRAEKNGNLAEVKTRYRYIGEQGDIAFSQIKWQGENEVGAEKTLSALVTQGELFEDIEKVILLVQGILASDAGNSQLALDKLQNLDTKDSTAILLKGMVQADNHLKQGDNDKALAAYDQVLATHPNYWLARNNRGMLEMQAGEYLNAITDISAALEKRQDDADLLMALANAYEKSEQLYPAKATYEKVVQLKSARTQEATKRLETTNSKIIVQEKAIQRVEQKDAARRTIQDTIALLDAHRNLGQHDKTSTIIASTNLSNKTGSALVAREVEALLWQQKNDDAQKVLDAALAKGFKKEDILKNVKDPSVKKFVLRPLQQ